MSVFEIRHKLQRDTYFLYFIFVLLLILFFCVSQLVAAKIAAFSHDGKILYFSKETLAISCSLILMFFMMYLSKLSEFGKGEKIAKHQGALEVTGNTTNPYYRIYNRLVTETAIAYGAVAPRIYFLPFDISINAFAAGNSPEDAIIVVTEGALEKLNQEELHALIAHEMSHIVHYDTRFNAHLSSIVYSMMGISIVGEELILFVKDFTNEGNPKSSAHYLNPFFYLGKVIVLFGNLFSWSGQLLQSKIAQKREFLADSESVRALRNHTGIISLLNKIRTDTRNISQHNPHQEYSHFYFSADRLFFPSHPPVSKRIRAINMSGSRYLNVRKVESTIKEQVGVEVRESDASLQRLIKEKVIYRPEQAIHKREVIGFATLYELEKSGLYDPPQMPSRKLTFDERLENFIPNDFSSRLMEMDVSTIFMLIPDEIKSVMYQLNEVEFLLYALILEEDINARQSQLAYFMPEDAQKIRKLHEALINNSDKIYIYIIFEIIFPLLRSLENSKRTSILTSFNRMLPRQDKLSVRQFCIAYTLNHALNDMNAGKPAMRKNITKPQLYELTHGLLSIIAQKMSCYDDKDEQDIHLIIAMRKIYSKTRRRALILDANWQQTFTNILDDFQWVPLKEKEKVIDALIFFVKLDQEITPSEYDVVRLISYRLGIPLTLHLQTAPRI